MSVPMITEMHYVQLTDSKFNLLESMYFLTYASSYTHTTT